MLSAVGRGRFLVGSQISGVEGQILPCLNVVYLGDGIVFSRVEWCVTGIPPKLHRSPRQPTSPHWSNGSIAVHSIASASLSPLPHPPLSLHYASCGSLSCSGPSRSLRGWPHPSQRSRLERHVNYAGKSQIGKPKERVGTTTETNREGEGKK